MIERLPTQSKKPTNKETKQNKTKQNKKPTKQKPTNKQTPQKTNKQINKNYEGDTHPNFQSKIPELWWLSTLPDCAMTFFGTCQTIEKIGNQIS